MREEPDDRTPDDARSDADWEALARAVERLSERVERLERALPDPARGPAAVAPVTSAPVPPEPPKLDAQPESARAAKPDAREVAARLASASTRPSGPAAAAPTGPLARLRAESGPVVLLGITGGLALLMGLLYFAWYSIRQGWLPVEVRLLLSASVGAAALGLAWRLAPRGHTALSEGLGGAGLGAWFGAALVARHGHELIGPMATFALLVVGAGAGLGVAAHRNLRKLALFATLGAFLTPLTIGAHSLGLSELLAYQLVIVAFLYALEDRRPWPELGHLGNVSSWWLLLHWSQQLTGTTRTEELTWLFALFVLGHLQLASLVWRRHIRLASATPRLWLHVFAAWAVAAALIDTSETLGLASLGMAAINGGAALLLVRALERSPGVAAAHRGLLLGACATAAWLQVYAFGPTYFDRLGSLYWWTGMASIATALQLRAPSVAKGAALALPLFAAMAASLSPGLDAPAWLGFYLAALPLLLGLRPGARALAERVASDPLYAVSVLWGCAAWAASSWRHLDEQVPREGWFAASCWVAAAVVTARCVRAPSPSRAAVVLFVHGVLLAFCIALSLGLGYFRPVQPFAPGKLWQLGVLLGVAALTYATSASFRREPDESWRARTFEFAALVRTTAFVVVAMLLVTGTVPLVTDNAYGARSLNQAGWSVAWAVAGLSLLLRGLFARRGLWRKAGLVLLFTTAGKLLVVDLTFVSMMWRVLSFAGLGVCMLAGAYYYRRLSDSLKPGPAGASGAADLETPTDS